MNTPPHEPEYVDEDFERFRRERLAKKKPPTARHTAPEPAPAEPQPATEPEEGYLDDGFAAFRTARLKKGVVEEPPAEAAEPAEPEVPDHGLFFGTTSNERRQMRARTNEERESRKMSRAEVKRATARTRRQPAPALPERSEQSSSPPTRSDLRKKAPRRSAS